MVRADIDTRETDTASRSQCQTLKKGRLNMTFQELLQVHKEIEEENTRRVKEWKEDQEA
jgi:hypothetical protein